MKMSEERKRKEAEKGKKKTKRVIADILYNREG